MYSNVYIYQKCIYTYLIIYTVHSLFPMLDPALDGSTIPNNPIRPQCHPGSPRLHRPGSMTVM